MIEKCANIFLLIDKGVVRRMGVVWHDLDGTDAEKMALLKAAVKKDSKDCMTHGLTKTCLMRTPNGRYERGALSYACWKTVGQANAHMQILEETIFCHYRFTPASPLIVVTCIVDGKVRIDLETDLQGQPS